MILKVLHLSVYSIYFSLQAVTLLFLTYMLECLLLRDHQLSATVVTSPSVCWIVVWLPLKETAGTSSISKVRCSVCS